MTTPRLALALLSLLLAMPSLSSAAQPTGLEIMRKVYDRPKGRDQSARLTMTLTNASGKSRVRSIQQFSKQFDGGERKIMFFVAPADVKNTSFMNWSYDDASKSDDQWIYLPALKKVKRISSDSKGDAFMGSDFTYDDLGDRHPDEDTHAVLREETLEGVAYWVVESKPKSADDMYSRTVSWIAKDSFIGRLRAFYDEDGALLKKLAVVRSEKIGGYDVVTLSRMRNEQTGHSTEMKLENVKLDQGIDDGRFTERMMKRGL